MISTKVKVIEEHDFGAAEVGLHVTVMAGDDVVAEHATEDLELKAGEEGNWEPFSLPQPPEEGQLIVTLFEKDSSLCQQLIGRAAEWARKNRDKLGAVHPLLPVLVVPGLQLAQEKLGDDHWGTWVLARDLPLGTDMVLSPEADSGPRGEVTLRVESWGATTESAAVA